MSLLSAIRRTAVGAAIIDEWLGKDGVPVSRTIAESRSNICLVCAENKQPGWWDRITNAIALWIRRALVVKHELNLFLPNEEHLGMCKICGCCNRLAPWTPIEHIKNHTPTDVWAKFPKHCWKVSGPND